MASISTDICQELARELQYMNNKLKAPGDTSYAKRAEHILKKYKLESVKEAEHKDKEPTIKSRLG
jgi:hypothetical protein